MTYLIFIALMLGSAGLTLVMIRKGVLDHPGERSSHDTPIPKGGGVGIAAASLAGVVLLGGPILPRMALGVGGLLLALVGYWDDRHQYRPAVKFGAQYVAAMVPVALTQVPLFTGDYALDAMISVGWVLLVVNAVNFMDGLNGLSAGVSAIVAAGLGLSELTIGLVAGVLGFLPFNFPRARIFMGDVGSQFCGYALALLGLLGWDGPRPLLVPFALAGVLFDVIFTLGRRMIADDHLTQAHRGHLYQIANRAGVAAPVVTLVEWGFAVWGVFLGVQPWHFWLIGAVLLPQVMWLGFVVDRARRMPVGRW